MYEASEILQAVTPEPQDAAAGLDRSIFFSVKILLISSAILNVWVLPLNRLV